MKTEYITEEQIGEIRRRISDKNVLFEKREFKRNRQNRFKARNYRWVIVAKYAAPDDIPYTERTEIRYTQPKGRVFQTDDLYGTPYEVKIRTYDAEKMLQFANSLTPPIL